MVPRVSFTGLSRLNSRWYTNDLRHEWRAPAYGVLPDSQETRLKGDPQDVINAVGSIGGTHGWTNFLVVPCLNLTFQRRFHSSFFL